MVTIKYTKYFILSGILLIFGVVIGIIISPNEKIYNHFNLNFVQNATHGDSFNMTPEDIIISYRIHCKSYKENGDVIDINMCEECWEGINCYQKTWDVVYRYNDFLIREGIKDNATDFCDEIIESGFFIITWDELKDYRLNNNFQDSELAYKKLFDKKCHTNLSIFKIEK